MNWLKIAALAIGALLAFVIVGSVVHLIMSVLGWVLIIALVGGAGYVAYKIGTSGRGRQVRDRRRERALRDDYGHADHDRRHADHDYRQAAAYDTPPPAPRPSRPNVDDDLERLKREMGH